MHFLVYIAVRSYQVYYSVISNAICLSSLYKNNLPEPSRCLVHIGNFSPASKRFLCLRSVMLFLFLFCLVKTTIVGIQLFCKLSQVDNCCPTTFFRNLQCLSSLFRVRVVLRGHYMIESFYDGNLCFFTVVLVIVFTVILMPFIVYI